MAAFPLPVLSLSTLMDRLSKIGLEEDFPRSFFVSNNSSNNSTSSSSSNKTLLSLFSIEADNPSSLPLSSSATEEGEGRISKTNLRREKLKKEQLRAASVLVLISSDQMVLLTLRSKTLRSHPGEVCFPGGRQDILRRNSNNDHSNDTSNNNSSNSNNSNNSICTEQILEDEISCAVRETYEEVGLNYLSLSSSYLDRQKKIKKKKKNNNKESSDTSKAGDNHEDNNHEDNDDDEEENKETEDGLRILCRLPTLESAGNLCVTPIVGVHPTKTSNELHQHLVLNPEEVDTAFWVPLSYFCDGNHQNNNLIDCYEIPNWPVVNESFLYRHYEYEFDNDDESKPKQDSTTTAATTIQKKKNNNKRKQRKRQRKSPSYAITGLTANIIHQVANYVYYDDQERTD